MPGKLTIEEMHQIAEDRGGRCLSTKYIDSQTNLKWSCDVDGHPSWKATPGNIKAGKWCKKCSIIKRNKRLYKIAGTPQKRLDRQPQQLLGSSYAI